MSEGLDRTPAAVVDTARAVELDGNDRDPHSVEVVVADAHATGDATRTETGYEGPDAVACGHLAAALAVADAVEGVRVHHGDVDLTRDGPWLVLAPLSGFVATVATGTATATVTVPLDGDPRRVRPVRERLDSVLAAARARHDHYPVADDDRGVFRTGLTTLSVSEVTVTDDLRVRFDVSTTPATTQSELAERFRTGIPVDEAAVDVDLEFQVGVERASPSAALREAVEDAHRAVVGDAGYEWLPRPTVFSRLPAPEKVAFGAGRPGDRFDHDDFERTRDLLERVVDRLQQPEESR
ncbi:hypothetical protein [Salinigranum salinum]|uniref:hypothetical protein n=1 Tax=Salinigranum salinum TaxID=1364937 RepID=UPI001260BEC7|nr:hypothetical protein [Salinigranum salinum]